ncbi:hypothetical protein AAW14_06105 [Streptomyces hygroscopicus]|uniref:hypothetical protein n=1 Tax=Streptomyces hygroscopicus TaxID=1912 RepID=UPI00224090B5|nr:hypothetical protein [Streptomyces hygroscopicus]MCW7941619.1 hypothetical protein [Streptomyces hygroscopicus]
MSIDHRAEAEKHLATADRHLTENKQDMRIAEVSAWIGQGHAALAANTVNEDLREANEELRTRLHSTRRWVAGHIAHALVCSDRVRRREAIDLAKGLDSADANIDDLVDEHLSDDGYDPKAIWKGPYIAAPAADAWAAKPDTTGEVPDIFRQIIVARLAEMLLAPGSDEVRQWARNITFELKSEGVDLTGDIEKRITDLALGPDPSEPPF